MTKLLLIDGSSLLHRAFYALPLLSNSDGLFTNAVHGFMMMLNKTLAQRKPDYLAVAFDKSRITFRNQIDPDYKGTRQETPIELRGQFELIKQVLELNGLTWLEQDNYEADDIIGTLADQGAARGWSVEILSGDRDLLQLVDDNITVFLTRKGISDVDPYDAAAVQERFGCAPKNLIDLKGLMGDSSDNIPGVPGVGEKTAAKLLAQYEDLEQLYNHLDEVAGKLRQKLDDNRELAFRCRQLATICRETPLNIQPEQLTLRGVDTTALQALYAKLGLRQLQRGLEQQPSAPSAISVSAADAEDRPWPTAEEEAATTAAAAPNPDAALTEGLTSAMQQLDVTKLCLLIPQQEGLLFASGGAVELVSLADLPSKRQLIEDASLPKLCWDAKLAAHLLHHAGITLAGLSDDALIAAYLLDPARSDYLLSDLLLEHNLPSEEAQDLAHSLGRLCRLQRVELDKRQMTALYEQVELPLTQVLARMELHGVRVERSGLEKMSEQLAAAAAEYQEKIFALAGHEFNISSPKQLGVVLFEEMGIPPVKKTKTGYSTDAEVLEGLAPYYDIARLIVDYRLVVKLRSTYTDGLAKLIAEDGKIHTSFKQTVTATGRLSSVEPNLQNIPVRQELGRQIRQVFVADEPGHILLAADYNQIELRVLAHISGDDKLRQAYLDGVDIHTRTASEVMGIAADQVTAEQRRAAKAVNFGIVYGISDYGLARDLGISRKEAQQYIQLYFARYPGVAAYQQQTILQAKEKGYVETMFGRRRYLPDLANRNFNLRSLAERMAINTPIQGTAADIIKLAMVQLQQQLDADGCQAKMLLQVHDELIFDLPEQEVEYLAPLVRRQMEGAVQLSVPLTVEVKLGHDWYHMEKVK